MGFNPRQLRGKDGEWTGRGSGTHLSGPHVSGSFIKHPKPAAATPPPKPAPKPKAPASKKAPTYGTDKGGRITRSEAAAKMFGAGSAQHKKAVAMDMKSRKKK